MRDKASLLPWLAVNRPITITVTLAAIIVLGIIAYLKIPIELLPSGFNPPYLGVWVSYPNANPQEVEEQITRPMEEQLRTIPGITKINTFSNSNGCWAWLEFSRKTNMDVAYDQLRDRMERARATFPDDFQRYFLRRFGRNDTPIIFLSVTFPPEVEDPYFVVDQFVKRPIERIDGVGNIEIWGADEKSIQILIDQDKVKAYRLNMYQIISELRRDNFALSSGWVYEGGRKFLVRSVGRFKSIDEIRKLPINKYGLRLGDIAEVRYAVEKRSWTQRINGRPGLLLGIYKESLANSVELSHKLEDLLEKEILTRPEMRHADVEFLFVQGKMIEDSIDNLMDTAIWGGIFAILILLFFLRNIRMTFIMMISIPLSILISLMVIYFIGWSLNVIIMVGLMISVGMVVDNAIVVLENIYHRRTEGLTSRKASILGASEVNLAIVMATLTTIAVFVPMILIDDGGVGMTFYMQRIGLPVIFSLLASLFVALVLIPLATTKLGGKKQAEENRIITRTKEGYTRLLDKLLNRRLDLVIVVIGLFWITFAVLIPQTPKSDQQSGNISDIWLIFDLPNHLTTDEANAYFKSVEDTIFAHSTEYDIKAVDTGFRRGLGRIRIYLNPPPKEQWFNTVYRWILSAIGKKGNIRMGRDEVLADIQKRIPKKPGVTLRTSWRGGEIGEEGVVSIMLFGDDTNKLAELAKEVERRMRLLPEVISVETDRESGADEIRITMDRDIATRNNINPDQVAYTVMYAVRGITLPKFQSTNKEIEMRIQLQEADRENLQQLKNMTFTNRQGRPIPLSAIASFGIEKGFGEISRENGKTYLQIKAKTLMEDIPKISAQIDQIMKDFPLPVGYRWEKGARFSRFAQQNQSFTSAIILSVIFVYILMAILFESLVLPLSIMLAIPLALFGAYLALFVTKTPQDMMAGIGIVILIGVVVNNGIVLIDMINRRRREGYGRRDAILDAAKNRFRPILMTSFTTIGGLIPMAIGSANLFGFPYAPMGRALIGGLLTGTFLTLLVVPLFYTLFDDLAIFLTNLYRWFRKPAAADGEVPLSTREG
ncbi:MAG: efflux RND transporter permease subunit [Calditrichaeota bacterium]|nr:MAG: efflux RND transporter permease subunit [Calditrichota bacterium]